MKIGCLYLLGPLTIDLTQFMHHEISSILVASQQAGDISLTVSKLE